jgi:hypothetical protein
MDVGALTQTSLIGLVFVSCASVPISPGQLKVDLNGLTLPLVSSVGFRFEVEAKVDEAVAIVAFEVASSLSFITKPCLASREMQGQAVLPDPFGPDETFELARIGSLTLGDRRFTNLVAGLIEGETCKVILGRDVLGLSRMSVNPARREVTFSLAKAAGLESVEVPLTFDPRLDWPLLPIRIKQGAFETTLVMLLSTLEQRTRVYDAGRIKAQLKTLKSVLGPLSALVHGPQDTALVPYTSLGFAPGFEVKNGAAQIENGSSPHGIVGVLALDVLARFQFTVDFKTKTLVLARPDLKNSCVAFDDCVEFHTSKSERHNTITATIWKPLPQGGTLYIQSPIPECRVGVSFAPNDVGLSHQLKFPWARLAPECQRPLGAFDLNPDFFLDEQTSSCQGTCGFVQRLSNHQLFCQCQPSLTGLSAETDAALNRAWIVPISPEPALTEPEDP